MRIETITKTILSFNELDAKQQSTVLDNLRDLNTDYEWYDFTKDDFHTILNILGFYNVESCFSGFCSQGDGASFEAMFTTPSKKDKIRDRLAKLKEYAPRYFNKNKDTLQALLDLDYQLSGYHEDLNINQSGYYCHRFTMSCDNENLLNVARDLAYMYYTCLENEYEYLISDESIKETILANEYEFDQDTLKIA